MIHWTESGIDYEADQRRVEFIVAELGLGRESKGVTMPGIPPTQEESEGNASLLEKGGQKSRYRGIVARANYLAPDRRAIQYSVKELLRGMANPTVGDQQGAKRLGRYLIGKTRYVAEFERQGRNQAINNISGTDYAACL